jgi:hypothetical protein
VVAVKARKAPWSFGEKNTLMTARRRYVTIQTRMG